ncbi:class I SAM-dependent methyltransferase [Sphingomonas sp. GB1N7]|uniref:class I SAM-dependent methyltransferase n=1 Tax=Parasphingomonas caseinilytica TaxID=3096158 RepID=UPI002FCCAFCB
MNDDLTRLCDPETGGALLEQDGKLVAGSGSEYPIVDGIPRFVSSEFYAADFGKQWRMFPKTQLDSFTGIPISGDRLKRCLGGSFDLVRGKSVLEAGSGAGRFTEVFLAEGAVLDSFDISSAVEANAQNNAASTFNLVQADIRSIPFKNEAYDLVVCLGVLQHTPDTEQSIASLWTKVKPGGSLVIDHYDWNRWRLPPPIGGAEIFHRPRILRMAKEKRWPAVKKSVDFWFPIYWRYRDSAIMRRILSRIGGINFYYPGLPLGSREAHYQWSLLDTHDARTDFYHRYRTVGAIKSTLENLGAVDIAVWKGGNGVEARCTKPL